MNTLGGITHDNPIIDKKVKAFYDYFHLYLNKSEYPILKFHPLDNHLSLLAKIGFRLNYSKIEVSSKKVLNQLLNHQLLDVKNDVIARKEKFKDLVSKIRSSHQNSDATKTKEFVEQAIVLLNGDYDLIKTDYLDFCLDELISYLSCVHELEYHKTEIEYFTKLIVAEFLRRNFDIDELIGVSSVFSKILSKDIVVNKTTKYVSTRFPLPPEIEKQRSNDQKFKRIVEDFLLNKSFHEQFKGFITSLQKNNRKGTFIVKVDNVRSNNDIDLSYGDIKIVSANNIFINHKTKSNYLSKYLDRYLNCKDCIYILKILIYESQKEAMQISFREAEHALSYLNYPNQVKGIIDKSEIFILSDQGLVMNAKNDLLRLTNEQTYSLNHYLNQDTPLYDYLFKLDKLYFLAFTGSVNEDKILFSWRYLEALTNSLDVDNVKRIRKISNILLNNEHDFIKEKLGVLIINYYNNNRELRDNPNYYLGVDSFDKSIDNSVQLIKTNNNYPFINELIESYENIDIDYEMVYNNYIEKLQYLYEQRNLIIHKSDICNISISLFVSVIQILIKRVRSIVLSNIKENDRKDLKSSLDYLIQKGERLKIN